MNTNAQNVAAWVRRWREDARLNVTELGQKAGIDKSNISRIESGKIAPSIETLQKIGDAMDLPAAAFLVPYDPAIDLTEARAQASGHLHSRAGRCDMCGMVQMVRKDRDPCRRCKEGIVLTHQNSCLEALSSEDQVRLLHKDFPQNYLSFRVNSAVLEPIFEIGDLLIVDPDAPRRAGDVVLMESGGVIYAFKNRLFKAADAKNPEPIFFMERIEQGGAPRENPDAPAQLLGIVVELRRPMRFPRPFSSY